MSSREVEAKIAVDDFDDLRAALHEAGAVFLGRVLQTDTYYDTPAQDLQGEDRGIRIRRAELLESGSADWDLRPQLTCKGPRDSGSPLKSRREVQTRFDAPYVMAEVLETCGMQATMVVQKRRASYRIEHCLVELDELPYIGRFVEIEGPDGDAVQEIRDRLGLSGETILDSYLHLADERCRQLGRDARRVTFAAEADA